MLDEASVDKWEVKLTTSECRALINYLVVNAIDLKIKKNALRVSCFERIDFLIQWRKSDNDNKIKPRGAVSKIDTSFTNNF